SRCENRDSRQPCKICKAPPRGNEERAGLRRRGPAPEWLFPLDLNDLVSFGATRGHHFDLDALLLADKGAGERRGDGNLALLGVRSGLADKLPNGLLLGILVDQGDGRAEGDGFSGKLRNINNFSARQLVLELRNATLVERLGFLRRMVFGVLGKVAMGARVGNLLNDARALDLLA